MVPAFGVSGLEKLFQRHATERTGETMGYRDLSPLRGGTRRITLGLLAVCCILALFSGCPPSPPEEPTAAGEEFAAELAVVDAAGAHYDTLLAGGTAAQARQGVVDWLLAQPGVVAAGISSSGITVWMHFENDLTAALLTETFVDEEPAARSIPEPAPGETARFCGKGLMPATFLAPFRFQQPNWGETIDLQEYYREPLTGQLSAMVLLNEDVSVQQIRNAIALTGAGCNAQHLIMSTHGGLLKLKGDPDEVCILCTGQPANTERCQVDRTDLKAGRLVVARVSSVGKKYFAFSPRFVERYSGQPDPEDRHWLPRYVYIGACYSAHTSMTDAFLGAGAVTYAGYDGPIYKSFHTQTGTQYFDLLAQCETTLDAYTDTTPKTDPRAGGMFLVEEDAADVRLFYRCHFTLAGTAMATVSHMWLSSFEGMMGLPCSDYEDNFTGSLTVQLDPPATGVQPIQEGSGTLVMFIDTLGRKWEASGRMLGDGAPCNGNVEVLEYGETGRAVRGTIDATLAYRLTYTDPWQQKTFLGAFVAVNVDGTAAFR